MRVEGRGRVAVPAHLDQLIAAGDRARARAHLIDLLPLALILALVVVGWLMAAAGNPRAMWLATGLQWSWAPLLAGYALAILALVVLRGQSFGMRVVGLAWVSVDTGSPAPARGLAKLALLVALALPSLGMAPVFVCLLTQGELNRTWIDRVCGTLTVRLPEDHAEVAPRRAEPALASVGGELKRYHLQVDPPQAPAQAVVGDVVSLDGAQAEEEAEWVPGTKSSSMDLASISRSRVDESRDSESLALSDDQSLSQAERSVGRRPDGSVRLVFDDGTRYDLVDTLLIGRDPVGAGRFEGAAVLAVRDSARSVSKVHLALWVRDGEVFVEDLYSTNGTRWSMPGGELRPFEPGVPQAAGAGSLIHFGDRQLLIAG